MLYLVIFILVGIIAWLLLKPHKVEVMEKQEWQTWAAMGYLKKTGEITNQQYRELTKVSPSQATRDLDEMERQGLIKQVGKTGRDVKYTLK